MPRGCQNKRPKKSEAKWAARKNPKGSHKPKALPTTISDERPSQRLARRRVEVAPEWAKLRKKDYETIPGTRIQSLPGGIAVRVILEDGKRLPPLKVLAAKRHLRKLAENAQEKAEINKMIHGNKQMVSIATEEVSGDAETAEKQLPEPSSAETPSSAQTSKRAPSNKKARKEAAWRERQQKLAEAHAASIQDESRELVSEQCYEGEVIQRAKGKAWIKMRDAPQLPEMVLSRLRSDSAEIKNQLPCIDGEIISVRFADVVDKGLDLKPGVPLEFKVFTDKHGVGACDARSSSSHQMAAAAKRPREEAEDEPGEETSNKRAKVAETAPADEAAASEGGASQATVPEKCSKEEQDGSASVEGEKDVPGLAAVPAAPAVQSEQEKATMEVDAAPKAEPEASESPESPAKAVPEASEEDNGTPRRRLRTKTSCDTDEA